MIRTILAIGGLSFTNVLNELDQLGFFAYILPFLLIFALVYAIVTKLDIFQANKGAGLIVALAVGLLALQLDFVPNFFQVIFPKLGIGLSVLLAALILIGAFFPTDDKGKQFMGTTFIIIGGIIFLFVLGSSFGQYGALGYGFWNQYGTIIIVLAILIGAVLAVKGKAR